MKLKSIFTTEYIARLEALDLDIKKRLSSSTFGGARRSSQKGSSLEFSDFRDYVVGDDLRRVDWNGYARLGKLYTKLFYEEKQASITIIIDASKSMSLLESKWDYSRGLCASLAYLALKNTDRVNIVAILGNEYKNIMGLVSKNSFSRVIDFLDSDFISGKTYINQSIKNLGKENLGNGITYFVSDFFSEDGYEDAIKALRSKGNELSIIQILDEKEVNIVESGNVRLIDSETGDYRELEITKNTIDDYNKALDVFKKEIKSICVRNNADFFSFDTSISALKALGNIIV